MLSLSSNAQSNVSGLGWYRIGVTTPDSLNRIDFVEEEQSYVKGTLTLPCSHVRTFTSSTVIIEDVAVTNFSLAFYDNKLFKISCDYGGKLKEAFLLKYGKGIPRPERSFLYCADRKDEPLVLWGEVWQNSGILAFVVHTRGYNVDCRRQEEAKLTLSSQRFSDLSSECELKNSDLAIKEFVRMMHGQQR